jgi:hypothetical protein
MQITPEGLALEARMHGRQQAQCQQVDHRFNAEEREAL